MGQADRASKRIRIASAARCAAAADGAAWVAGHRGWGRCPMADVVPRCAVATATKPQKVAAARGRMSDALRSAEAAEATTSSPVIESCIVLVGILAAAGLGIAGGVLLPEHHVDERARTHVFGSISVVATLTALSARIDDLDRAGRTADGREELQDLSANVIRLDRLLRAYGPDADGARAALGSYVAHKRDDLFPTAQGASPKPGNLATVDLAGSRSRRRSGAAAKRPRPRSGANRRRCSVPPKSPRRHGPSPSKTRSDQSPAGRDHPDLLAGQSSSPPTACSRRATSPRSRCWCCPPSR